jgi:hypothetical protein
MDNFVGRKQPRDANPARFDAQRLADEVVPLVNQAQGVTWYTHYDNAADVAVVGLCRLRRAASGSDYTPVAGDEAVRAALERSEPEAVVWLASRLVSYMDEQGYPETLEPWLGS